MNRAIDGGFRTVSGGVRVFIGGSVASAAAVVTAEIPFLAPMTGPVVVFGASEVVAGADDIQVGVQDVYYGVTKQNEKESKSFLKDEIMGGNQDIYENFHIISAVGMHASSPNIAVTQKPQKPPNQQVKPQKLNPNSANAVKGTVRALPSEVELNGAVSEWSRMQKALAPSKTKLDNFNTGTIVYDSRTGQYYYGMNKGLRLSGDKLNSNLSEILPEKSLNNLKVGNCAEVDAVNQALNNNANLNDLYMYTIHTTPSKFGLTKGMCENCQYTFNGKVSDVLSK